MLNTAIIPEITPTIGNAPDSIEPNIPAIGPSAVPATFIMLPPKLPIADNGPDKAPPIAPPIH